MWLNSIGNKFKQIFCFDNLAILILVLWVFVPSGSLSFASEIADPNPLRFQKEINRFNWQDAKNSFPRQALLFIGSSSIYKWKTAHDFPTHQIINRGFGGAHISDINHYYNEIVTRYKPTQVIFYCGDNDVAANKTSVQILADFTTFSRQLKQDLPVTKLLFLAIKPSPARWYLWSKMAQTNLAIATYCQSSNNCTYIDTATPLLNSNGVPNQKLFAKDGLHLSGAGYAIWRDILYRQGI